MKGISTTSALPVFAARRTGWGGTVELTGTRGPLNSADTAATPFEATLKIKHLDLVASGLVIRPPECARVADLEAPHHRKTMHSAAG